MTSKLHESKKIKNQPKYKHADAQNLALENATQNTMLVCAKMLKIGAEELQSWLDSHISIEQNLNNIPIKTQLQLWRLCQEYQLDPLKGELQLIIYEQKWQAHITVDGWLKLIHRHPHFSGISFNQPTDESEGHLDWMECTIYRSDHSVPTTIREYYEEVKQDGDPWNKMPRRMLRHRVLQQCARVAMGLHIFDVLPLEKSDVNMSTTKDESPMLKKMQGIQGLKSHLLASACQTKSGQADQKS